MSITTITSYFPELEKQQIHRFMQLEPLYSEWNSKINVISRKDINHLYVKHILHSLAIRNYICFRPKAEVMDVGTGGGFPGIPLAIMFPQTHFYLIDAIAKKIKVVQAIAETLELQNITAVQIRAEKVTQKFDFVVSRAVTYMPDFVKWVRGNIKKKSVHTLQNGIFALKGGDLREELAVFKKAQPYAIADYFKESFFETKKVVYLPL